MVVHHRIRMLACQQQQATRSSRLRQPSSSSSSSSSSPMNKMMVAGIRIRTRHDLRMIATATRTRSISISCRLTTYSPIISMRTMAMPPLPPSSSAFTSLAVVAPPPLQRQLFSSSAGTTLTLTSSASKNNGRNNNNGAAGLFVLFVLGIMSMMSDPAISAYEAAMGGEEENDENESYWMSMHKHQNHPSRSIHSDGGGGDEEDDDVKQSRLRNAHKHHYVTDSDNNNNNNGNGNGIDLLPTYSRIVIVGGGMAGLHTALALAERMSDPDCQDANPPTTTTHSSKKSRWWPLFSFSNKSTSKEVHSHSSISNNDNVNNAKEIIVLDASRIGNGASGRAKGLVVPGFQVPLENLQESALDYHSAHDDENNNSNNNPWTVPAIVQSLSQSLGSLASFNGKKSPQSSHPRYTKAVVEQMYESSYNAMERLRAIVKLYEIDCDWVDSGAVEGSIHPMENDDEDNSKEDDDDDDDECQMLTSEQVNEIMGRSTTTSRSESSSNRINDDNINNQSLYKWGEYDPSCAGVNPLALTIGLADAVERWGVSVYEYTKVTRLEKLRQTRTLSPSSSSSQEQEQQKQQQQQREQKGKYKIVTDQGHTIHCDHVVLCTGAESLSEDVSARLSGAFVPVYTWMAATEPLYDKCPLKNGVVDRVLSSSSSSCESESTVKTTEDNNNTSSTSNNQQKQEERPAPMCGDDHISLNYWRRSNNDNSNNNNYKYEEGRLLFGSLADTYSLPKWLISWRLKNALTEVYPQLSNVTFDHVWGGKLAFTLNSMPLIGRDTDYDDDDDDDDDDTYTDGNTAEDDSTNTIGDDNTGNSSNMGSAQQRLTKGGVWYATGFAGHGIVPTALAGSLLANAILGIPDSNDHDQQHQQQQQQQQLQLFQTYFPLPASSSWNGYPFSRMGAQTVLLVYNMWDWLGCKKGVPLPPLPKLW